MKFKDRADAGKQLAEKLQKYKGQEVVILGMARGGMPIAHNIAQALEAPIDVVVVKKLGAPSNKEYAIGAVAPNGINVTDSKLIQDLGITLEELENILGNARDELQQKIFEYKGYMPEIDVDGVAIVVDDGAATGASALAAIEYVRTLDVKKIVFATPVASRLAIDRIEEHVDELVVLHTPEEFQSVGEWYESFEQVEDKTVKEILGQ